LGRGKKQGLRKRQRQFPGVEKAGRGKKKGGFRGREEPKQEDRGKNKGKRKRILSKGWEGGLQI